jgi:hypothetical protein
MKFLLIFFCATLNVVSLYGGETVSYSLEGKVSGFLPTSKRIREVYKDGWADYEIQATQTLCSRWALWESVHLSPVSGKSTALHNKTRLNLWGLKGGVERRFDYNDCFSFYAGVGASYQLLHIHDQSHYVRKHFYRNKWGAVIKTGIRYVLSPGFFISINAEYLYQRFCFSGNLHPHVPLNDVDLSGFVLGAGISVLF